jgi:hypothetical protein
MGEGPSGADILDEVRRRWPRTARIVVSGTGAAHALVAIGVAERFIPKPWERGTLLKAVRDLVASARAEVS